MNLNYKGSLAERRMNFASTADVVVNNSSSELFNAISVYVPSSLAEANIVDWDPSFVSAELPAVFTCVVDNYATIMKGVLLDQWANVFRQDTNTAVTVFVIVFADDSGTDGLWEIDSVSIKFAPLTKAFNMLHNISFIKVMFDETHDGAGALGSPYPGTAASAQFVFRNTSSSEAAVPVGQYTFNDGVKDWVVPVDALLTIPGNSTAPAITGYADSVGNNAALPTGQITSNSITPALPSDITLSVTSVTQGTNPAPGQLIPSKYFDLVLALAYQCKLDVKLSWLLSLVKISYVDQGPNPSDACWIRYRTRAEQLEAMQSIVDNDRAKYFWAALYLMECKNTTVLIHSEPVNIIVEMLAGWFVGRNDSGQFIGNKLSLLRLSGTRIKPLGFPSLLDTSVNENDADGFDQLDEMNVGYLATIADNTPQESYLSAAKGVTGTPMTMQMISKFVDYECAKNAAIMITDTGTATKPVLTDETAYSQIQKIVQNTLALFAGTNGRIYDVDFTFPAFNEAKKGRTALAMASSWKGYYKDDLDSIECSGGLVAE
jgi:hypothetical protein